MSEIADLLWLKAQELGKEASASINEWQMIKSAAVSTLTSNGIDLSDAEDMLEKLAEESNPNLEKDARLAHIASILEKAAQYVTELEVKLDSKEAEIDGLNKAASAAVRAPSVDALTGTGAFTSEDLETLSRLDSSTLSKVAGLADKTPWNLGGPSNQHAAGSSDALTEFLLS